MERFRPDEDPNRVKGEVGNRCRQFRVKFIGADGGGNGTVYNSLLQNELQYQASLYAILYSDTDQEPRQDGKQLWKWIIGRSRSIGSTFARIKKKMIDFPGVQACGTFLDEFTCELAQYDDQSRIIRYTHPDGAADDALHATNYLEALGLRMLHSAAQGRSF